MTLFLVLKTLLLPWVAATRGCLFGLRQGIHKSPKQGARRAVSRIRRDGEKGLESCKRCSLHG
eukprot:SAG31_NODE_30995_length_373_cov_1.474453_1_plen_62_part_01